MLNEINKITLIILLLFGFIIAEVKINAQDGSEDDRYGQSVALSSDFLFIGANRDFNNGINSGAVYVYSYDENMSVSFLQKLIPSDYSNDQYFGKSISCSNNWLAVSAIYDDSNGLYTGEKKSKISVVMFSDYNCSYCKKAHKDIVQLTNKK